MTKQDISQLFPAGTRTFTEGRITFFEVQASDIVRVTKDMTTEKEWVFKLMTATDERTENGCFKIWYVFGNQTQQRFVIFFSILRDTLEFPSITGHLYEAWNYERRIHTFFGLTPVGHPDLRPLILHENWPEDVFPLRKDFDGTKRPADAHGTYTFQKVKGEGIYEIPVGPVHAGIIEPGHFRFSVAGESIVSLEARLGFTHKGSEKLFETLPLESKLKLSEKISGDSSFSHSLAFCQAVETLGDMIVPKRAQMLRVVYAELERLANHFGDIGAMTMDTGFNFGGAHGARIRERVLQMNEKLTGSRFLRGVNMLSGVTKDITDEKKNILLDFLSDIKRDFSEIIDVAENSTSLLNRMKETGMIGSRIATKYGVLGVAGRAIGRSIDTRRDYPYAGYEEVKLGEIPFETTGDVYARFHIRIKEAYISMRIIEETLASLPEGSIILERSPVSLKKNAVAIGMVEGWRGEIIYFVATDATGTISRVMPRDPSFVNWSLLHEAATDNVVPDFPLINKSFNLSYSGNDL